MISFRGSDWEARGGFTLLELLVVIVIISLIAGLGAGAYQVVRRNFALEAAAGRLQGVIRAARNAAVLTGIPTAAVVDPVSRTAFAVGFEPVGEWSFEPVPEDLDAELGLGAYENRGASEIPDGKVGRALRFGNPPGAQSGSWIDCGRKPAFDVRAAVHCEAWVRYPAVRSEPVRRSASGPVRGTAHRAAEILPAAAILEKRGAYFLGLAPDGALEGAIGDYRMRTKPGAVSPDRWVHVALQYDGRSLELRVDGVPRAAESVSEDGSPLPRGSSRLPETVPITAAPVTISSPDRPFFGDVDEVRLAGAAELVEYQLDASMHILGWKKVIRFDRRGHLDPKFHTGDVRIVIVEPVREENPERAKTGMYVDYSLTFDEWLERWDDPPPLREAEEERRLEAGFPNSRKVVVEVEKLGVVR